MKHMKQVVSQAVRELGYFTDEPDNEMEDGFLYVRYNNGKLYKFGGVSREIYEQVLNADSVNRKMGELVMKKFPYWILNEGVWTYKGW